MSGLPTLRRKRMPYLPLDAHALGMQVNALEYGF
jgi:hypothetical protein